MHDAPIVYIVDDDPSVRRALRRLIRYEGFDVETAETVGEFLASEHSRRPACLILDVRLPGMSGIDLQSRLAVSEPDLPIVVVTAHAEEEVRRRMLAVGAVAFLSKPFDDDVLLGAIRRALGRGSTR